MCTSVIVLIRVLKITLFQILILAIQVVGVRNGVMLLLLLIFQSLIDNYSKLTV